VQKAKDIKQQA